MILFQEYKYPHLDDIISGVQGYYFRSTSTHIYGILFQEYKYPHLWDIISGVQVPTFMGYYFRSTSTHHLWE